MTSIAIKAHYLIAHDAMPLAPSPELLSSEPWRGISRLAQRAHSLSERSLFFYNPCVDAWFDCCNNTGVSHRQSNLECAVSIARLAGRSLVVEQHTEAAKHTRCASRTLLDWRAFYSLDAIQTDLGVKVYLEPPGVVGSSRLPFRPRSLLARPRLYAPDRSLLVELVDSVPKALASSASLVVMLQGVRFCAPFHVCEHSKTHVRVMGLSPNRTFHLPPAARVREALEKIVLALGDNFTGVHVRQGDRVGMIGGSGVPRMSGELVYASIASMAPRTPRPTLFVSTDAPALLREGEWALKLAMEFRVHSITDFWPIVRDISELIPREPSECNPYVLAHLEKLILARAWRFILTEVSTFDHHVRNDRYARSCRDLAGGILPQLGRG